MRKKRYGSKSSHKRTLSSEHLAKMQAGRERARAHRLRMAELKEVGLPHDVMPEGYTKRMLDSVRERRSIK